MTRTPDPYTMRDFDPSDLVHPTYRLNIVGHNPETGEKVRGVTEMTVSLDYARSTLSPETIAFFTNLGGTEVISTLTATDDAPLLSAPYVIIATSTSPDGLTKVTRVFTPVTD